MQPGHDTRLDAAKLQAAAARLQAYKRCPAPGTQLRALFVAIDAAEGKSAGVLDTISYVLTLFYMSLAGFLQALDMRRVSKVLTHNSPSVGHRLRLRTSIAGYSVAVRASVGAQAVIRKVREDFCSRAVPTPLDLDKVVQELRLPLPAYMAAGGAAASSAAAADERFGFDVPEARVALDQLLTADVVSSYVAGLDAFVFFVGTMVCCLFTAAAAFVIFSFDPAYLLSTYVAGKQPPQCLYALLNATGGIEGCVARLGVPSEDGTSLYRMHLYVAIFIISVPVVYVCVTGLALQILLGMVATVLADISDAQALLMFHEHPKNPQGHHVPASLRQRRGQDMLAAGSFEARRHPHQEARGSAFCNEILVGRDSVLAQSGEGFLSTFNMMRTDVADASKRVGVNVQNMLTLITQGLAALSVFLIVTNAISIQLGQRLVVVLLFLISCVWTYILGAITRSARVYSFLVLAESSRYLNSVLHIDEGLVPGGGSGGVKARADKGGFEWPWPDSAVNSSAGSSRAGSSSAGSSSAGSSSAGSDGGSKAGSSGVDSVDTAWIRLKDDNADT